MALTIEDGTGVTDADSYNTIAEFKAYWLTFGVTITETDDAVELALREASQFMEAAYGPNLVGTKQTREQGLHFPTYNGVTRDGFTIADDEVPVEALDGQNELAKLRLDGVDLFNANKQSTGAIKALRTKVGPIEKETSYTASGSSTSNVFPKIDSLLANILNTAFALRTIRV